MKKILENEKMHKEIIKKILKKFLSKCFIIMQNRLTDWSKEEIKKILKKNDVLFGWRFFVGNWPRSFCSRDFKIFSGDKNVYIQIDSLMHMSKKDAKKLFYGIIECHIIKNK